MTIWHFFVPVVFFFGTATSDRAEHLIWRFVVFCIALGFAFGLQRLVSTRQGLSNLLQLVANPPGVNKLHAILLTLIVLYLGSWIPDLDWKLLDKHRHPLTHSIMPLLAIGLLSHVSLPYLSKLIPSTNLQWNELLLAVFAFGLGSHLLIDSPAKNVVYVKPFGFEFLLVNGLACLALGYYLLKRQIAFQKQT